jgi:hypothetical protein
MTDSNRLDTLSKKKSANKLTIPVKKPTTKTNNTTTTTKTATTKIKTSEVKPHKVQQHKAKKVTPETVRVQKNAHQQPVLSDYNLAVGGDASGLHITVTYQNKPIYKFSLLRSDYDLWQRMTPDQKYFYIQTKLHDGVFGNNTNLIHAVVGGICHILNRIFADAARIRAHKAQRRIA